MGRGKRPVGPITKAIAAELRAERGRADLTIRGVSERSGVPRTTVSKMLSGESSMDVPNLQAVCLALGVSLRDVIARAEATLPPPEGGHPDLPNVEEA